MPQVIFLLLFWLSGCCFGSFYTVIAFRVPKNQSIILPGSHCPACGHHLGPLELIPIFSYVLQKGKCKKCRCRISYVYPLTECLTGTLLTAACLFFSGQPLNMVSAILLVSFGIIFSLSDLYYLLLPNSLMILFFLSASLVLLYFKPANVSLHIISGMLFFGFFYCFFWLSEGGIGGGDVKLFAIIGLLLGWRLTLLTIVIACCFTLFTILLLLLLQKISRETPVPFAPFIFLGALFSFFAGDEIIHWFYRSFFL